MVERVHHHGGGDQREARGANADQPALASTGVEARVAAGEDEHRGADEREEGPLREHRVLQQLSVGLRDQQHTAPARLGHDRPDRALVARVKPRSGLEEQAIFGHREVEPRPGQDQDVHHTRRRDQHQDRDEARAGKAEHALGQLRRHRGRLGDLGHTQHSHIGRVDQRVCRDHDRDAAHDADRHRALGPFQVGAQESERVPAAVAHEDRQQGEQERTGVRKSFGVSDHREAGSAEREQNQEADGRELGQRQQVLHVAGEPHAAIVHEGQDNHEQQSDDLLEADERRDGHRRVAGERERDRGGYAGEDREEDRPPVEEGHARVVGLSQVHVQAAGPGHEPSELRAGDAAEHGG